LDVKENITMRTLFLSLITATLVAAGCCGSPDFVEPPPAVEVSRTSPTFCAYQLDLPFKLAGGIDYPTDAVDCVNPEPDGAGRYQVGLKLDQLILTFHVAARLDDAQEPAQFHLLAQYFNGAASWSCDDWDGVASFHQTDERWYLTADVICTDGDARHSVKLTADGNPNY
jgi:hypothetical protein